jgi:hypothetical protein
MMYHRVFELLDKLDVIKNKAEELRRVREYIKGHHTVQIDMARHIEQRDYLIVDIQALCRDIANDTREVKDD